MKNKKEQPEPVFLDRLKGNGSITPAIYSMRQFGSLKEMPTNFHSSWEYLYAIEVDGGMHLKIGYSKTPRNRIRTHEKDSDSPLCGRCGRIGILGPVRDGLNTEQMLHGLIEGFYNKEYFPKSVEIYSFDRLSELFRSDLLCHNMFDLFCGTTGYEQYDIYGGIFGLFQTMFRQSYEQDLIIPNAKLRKIYAGSGLDKE